jgi:hypothetical protein
MKRLLFQKKGVRGFSKAFAGVTPRFIKVFVLS